jgi:hypothetical protein
MLEADLIRKWIDLYFSASPRSLSVPVLTPPSRIGGFPTGGPAGVPRVEPGFCNQRNLTGKRKEAAMRSDLVHSAGRAIENRFLLATVVMRAIRALHIESTRTEDTANRVFSDISQGRYAPAALPEPAPPAPVEALITPAA